MLTCECLPTPHPPPKHTTQDDALLEERKDCATFLSSEGVPFGERRAHTNPDTAASVQADDPRTIDPRSPNGNYMAAAAQGDLKIVQALGDVDINFADYDMRTPMHVTASEGHLNVAEYLVEKGALINVRDRWGHTPLDDAIRGDHDAVIEFLQEHGAEQGYEEAGAVTDEELKLLQRRGQGEKWALKLSEITMQNKPFAKGAGGELFKAKWRGLTVVAKSCANMVSNERALLDLGNEISLLSTLRHPNLVLFLGASFESFPPILIMEYCMGGTLEERIVRFASEGKAMPRKEMRKYTVELALGMNFLHGCDPAIVHRDLKPSNILLTGDGNLKITDFGLSKFIAQKNKKMNDKFTMTGETGSYRFMAPEVFRHEQYNEKVDVYSYALIVFWMHAGTRPFVQYADPVAAVRAAALQDERPALAKSMEPRLRGLLKECWAPTPESRPEFQRIVEILAELKYDNGPLNHDGSKCRVQ